MGLVARIDHATVAYAHWLLRWRAPVLVLSLLFSAVFFAGLPKLVFDDDYRVFFRDDDPELIAYEAKQQTYTKDDSVFIVVTPKSGEVFTRDALTAIAHLTEGAWQLPYAYRVDSVTNFQHVHSVADDLFVEDLIGDPDSMTDADLDRARAIATQEPLLLHRILNEDASVTGIYITIQRPEAGPGEGIPVVQAARALIAETEARYPQVEVRLTGIIPLNNAFLEATQEDFLYLTPVMGAFILITMALLLRSVSLMAATMLIFLLSAGSALGLAGWLGIWLSGPSAPAPLMILTLSVADGIHVLSTFLWHLRHGSPKEKAIVESLRVNMQPVFITSLTTGIGFLSLNLNSVPPARDLGNIVVFGVIFAFLFSITVLPILASYLPVRVRIEKARTPRTTPIEKLGEWVIRHRRIAFFGPLLLTAVLASFIPRIEVNNSFVDLFDEETEIRSVTDYTTEHLAGIQFMSFSLSAKETGGVNSPEYLRDVARFEDWLIAQEGVQHVSSVAETMRRLNRTMNGDDPAYYTVPESQELAAQYLLLYEMSLPQGLDLTNQISLDRGASLVVAMVDNLSSENMGTLAEKANAWQRENLPPYMYGEALGPGVMFSHITASLMETMLVSMPMALFFVSLALIFALRSLRYGLLSLIPNLMPLVLGFGAWGLLDWEINFAMSATVAMALGIVVDDTVHFLSKYLRARREQGLSAEDAVRYAFASVGRALLVTSLVLVAGFLILTQSRFLFNINMGILSNLFILFALAGDLIFLPALLLYVDRRHTKGSHTLEEIQHEEAELAGEVL